MMASNKKGYKEKSNAEKLLKEARPIKAAETAKSKKNGGD